MEDYADVASFAERKGLANYNEAISIMEKDKLIPGYETPTFTLYKGVGRDYGYSDTLSNILDAYVSENGDTEILVN
jgi:hypothetical protein